MIADYHRKKRKNYIRRPQKQQKNCMEAMIDAECPPKARTWKKRMENSAAIGKSQVAFERDDPATTVVIGVSRAEAETGGRGLKK